jgi:dTDP-4-dehydrorhamnose 3,5-epimerase
MIFRETPLAGAYVIEIEPRADKRGFFARAFCGAEFARLSLDSEVTQANLSFNGAAGTLRGMHFQNHPHAETKIVRCTMGAIFDAMVDLRPDSPTFGRWFGEILTAENHKMLYVPKGFAHGYQTLEDNAEVFYMVSEPYAPSFESGLRWDDPDVGIEWPFPNPIVSDRDRELPLLNP